MKLSIIIVSYNAFDCLSSCMASLKKSHVKADTEIIIIDNASTDGTAEALSKANWEVQTIFNKDNRGYAKACNQGIKMATGNYVLLLNPDTVVAEDTLQFCIDFMEAEKDAGACGVRMVNCDNVFLKESKRGAPSVWNSFSKLSGLCKLFPASRFFSGYYRGEIPENAIAKVDVLTGAFMLVRSSVFEKVGLFDEDFFMYGEDVDFSMRIRNKGFSNYYIGERSIVHFKGESTRRSSLKKNYHFYNAMHIFINKHYKSSIVRVVLHSGIALAKFLRPVN